MQNIFSVCGTENKGWKQHKLEQVVSWCYSPFQRMDTNIPTFNPEGCVFLFFFSSNPPPPPIPTLTTPPPPTAPDHGWRGDVPAARHCSLETTGHGRDHKRLLFACQAPASEASVMLKPAVSGRRGCQAAHHYLGSSLQPSLSRRSRRRRGVDAVLVNVASSAALRHYDSTQRANKCFAWHSRQNDASNASANNCGNAGLSGFKNSFLKAGYCSRSHSFTLLEFILWSWNDIVSY